MKLKKEIKAYVEAELRDYHQTKQDLLEAKEDIMLETSASDNIGGHKTGCVFR